MNGAARFVRIGLLVVGVFFVWAMGGAAAGFAEGADSTAPSPESIDFGLVSVGASASAPYTFQVLETSETPAWVTIYDPCPPFGLAGLEAKSFSLSPGQSVTFLVTFAPTVAGEFSCALRVVAQGGYPVTTTEHVVALRGHGTGGGDETTSGETAWTPFPFVFLPFLPGGEAPAGGMAEATVPGVTDGEGRFSVLVSPSAMLTGRLLVCGGSAMSDAVFEVSATEQGYAFRSGARESGIVEPVTQFSLFGLTMADVGDVCLSPRAAEGDSIIRLLTPAAGEAFGMAAARFCWESLGLAGVAYDVVHVVPCDPASMGTRPHPFAPLLPDPALRARRRAARAAQAEAEIVDSNWRSFCAALDRTLAQIEGRATGVDAEIAWLLDGRLRADAADAKDVVLPLPGSCPRTLEELFAPFPLGFDDLTPCAEGACEAFAARIRGLIDRLQSLDARSITQALEFERLLRRWEDGAEHRGVMGLWSDFYGAIDGLIGLAESVLDKLTPDIRGELEAWARQFLLEENAANLTPSQLANLQAAAEAGDLLRAGLDLLKRIREGNVLGPGFLVQMVRAMAQQAGSAARGAVEGWNAFAAEMATVFCDAYESALCKKAALGWLAGQAAAMRAFCATCRECQTDRVAVAEEEVARGEAQEAEAAAARAAYWGEQLVLIDHEIQAALASVEDSLFGSCCRGVQQTASYRVPGDSECERLLEEALKASLGDRACFLTFRFEFLCGMDGFDLQYAHSFPTSERRPGCCVPDTERATTLARATAAGAAGEPICAPTGSTEAQAAAGRLRELGDGDWRVEARDAAGTLVGVSLPRALGPRAITSPPSLPVGPVPVPGCTCSVTATWNGGALVPGATVTIASGTSSLVAVGGDCGPLCAAGATRVTVQPPPRVSVGPTGSAVLAPRLPVAAPANQALAYDFPYDGMYAVTVTRFCEDGATCSTSFAVSARRAAGPVQRAAQPGEVCCSACGDVDCLTLSFRSVFDGPPTTVVAHRLSSDVPESLFFTLDSTCRADCVGARHVRWEVREPDGAFVVIEGEDLYEIEYSFLTEGPYTFCVIETVPCAEGAQRFETWLIVEADADG